MLFAWGFPGQLGEKCGEMMRIDSRLQRRSWLAALALLVSSPPSGCLAQVSEIALERAGLKLQWQSRLEQTQQVGDAVSVVVWPHSTDRLQYVALRSGDEILEKFDAAQVDRDAWQKKLLDLRNAKDANALKNEPQEIPRIGLEGARKLADQAEAKYKIAGRKVERLEVDYPITYLVATTANGAIQMLDAETGERLWTSYVGSAFYPTFAAGVSDDYVSVINGSDLYLLDIKDGTTINRRRCEEQPANGSIPVGNWIYVAGLGGDLMAYNAGDAAKLPWVQRSGGAGLISPVLSADRRFLAWVCAPKYLYMAKVDELRPQLWNRFESSQSISKPPVAVENGFVATSDDGTVVCLNIPYADEPNIRGSALRWRYNLGQAVRQAPAAAAQMALVVTSAGELWGLDLKTGQPVWEQRPTGVQSVVGATKEHAYVRDDNGQLAQIRLSDGAIAQRIFLPLGEAAVQSTTDRMYFHAPNGSLVCVRELGADQPTLLHPIVPSEKSDKKKGPKEPSSKPSQTKPASGDDPFGAPVTAPSNEDPFGGDAKPSSDDPFGGGAAPAGDDPFGGNQ